MCFSFYLIYLPWISSVGKYFLAGVVWSCKVEEICLECHDNNILRIYLSTHTHGSSYTHTLLLSFFLSFFLSLYLTHVSSNTFILLSINRFIHSLTYLSNTNTSINHLTHSLTRLSIHPDTSILFYLPIHWLTHSLVNLSNDLPTLSFIYPSTHSPPQSSIQTLPPSLIYPLTQSLVTCTRFHHSNIQLFNSTQFNNTSGNNSGNANEWLICYI